MNNFRYQLLGGIQIFSCPVQLGGGSSIGIAPPWTDIPVVLGSRPASATEKSPLSTLMVTVCVMCKQGLRKEDEEIVEAADYTLHGYIP